MRNLLKADTLESKLPLMSVEHDCIISKDADITIAYKVDLPEVFSITREEYEKIHSVWCKAIKVLPFFTIIHKQDWFELSHYQSEIDNDSTFLSRSSELFFNERPFFEHRCYLFITKTTKERMKQQSGFSSLCRATIIPKDIHPETISKFMEDVRQFEKIINDSEFISITRMMCDEIAGTDQKSGIIEKYLSLSHQDITSLKDITINPDSLKIGDKTVCLHTISDVEDLPSKVGTHSRFEKFSTDRSDCLLSFASPVGLLLNVNHIYNQFIFIDSHFENLKRFEKNARNLQSLSNYSRANQINKEWIDEYLNEAHSKGLTSVRAHFNIISWNEDAENLRKIKNEAGSQIALMDCKPRHNTVDVPTLYWSAIPGNEGDFPSEESFYTFLEQSLCFFTEETHYKSSLSPFGIKMVDRIGRPVHLDISDEPMKTGMITNRNKFVLGPSGSGKSFFTNHMVRQYYEQNSHVLLIDVGNSYKGLCDLIRLRTKGEDGIYYTFTEENPISFNPFFNEEYYYDVEKKESIKTLLLTLWKRDDEQFKRSEEVAISNAVNLYIKKISEDKDIFPCFNTFYEYLREEYRTILTAKNVREKEFDIDNFLNVLEPFYAGGEFDYLLNSSEKLDLLHKRFIVFELDNIKDHKILFPVTTLIIMETFINKMRRLKGVRKMILVEEAWKAIAQAGMASYIKYLFKTVRKHFGEAIVVTQELDDILGSEIVKESIINNADCKILLDQRKYMNKFDSIQELLGITDKEKSQILSINMANDPDRKYKEVFISLGGVHSAVYATEVSPEEYYTYTTEESEKMELQEWTSKCQGNLELAIKKLAQSKNNNP